MPSTWQQARRDRDAEHSRAMAWQRLARVAVRMARELQASGATTARTCERYDLALRRLRDRGERVEGL